MRAALFVLSLALALCAVRAREPVLQSGTLPEHWLTGGPTCVSLPDWQVHEYNQDFYILRESGCIHFEKPFLYLIFGREKALLEDTGAGQIQTSRFVMNLIARWAQRQKREVVPLIVIHSHGHGDHTAGDVEFQKLSGVEFVAATPAAVQKAAGIASWPGGIGSIDLGSRVIDVIPIPGHEAASIALYDRLTGNLLTGDSLYPGRLYVPESAVSTYAASAQRLAEFVADRPVAHVLGTHIEQMRTPYADYPRGTAYQPDEHALELSRAHVLELHDAFSKMNGRPEKVALPDFTIVPSKPVLNPSLSVR